MSGSLSATSHVLGRPPLKADISELQKPTDQLYNYWDQPKPKVKFSTPESLEAFIPAHYKNPQPKKSPTLSTLIPTL